MTQQVINIGAAPDDATGDPLRLSFDKTNENFTELYAKGATEGLWNYNKTSADTTTAPVSGRFKTNSGDYRGATQIAINAITIQGIDRSSTLRTLLVGDLIQCQDSTNAAAWCRYSLQSLPVDHGTWFQLNVTFQADGGVASGDNQEIVFVFTASSGAAGGGNVSNSGTPTIGQYGKWVTATTIQGVSPATVLSDIGAQPAGSYQPLDGDLTSLAAAAGINTIYYRSAADTWSAVTVGTGLSFSAGTLANTVSTTGLAPLASPTFTGDPKAPTPTAGDNDTSIATTAFVIASAPLGPPNGRLTLQSATPVMTTTQAAKTTIFYTPYNGNKISLWNGGAFIPTTFTEISTTTTDTIKNPAAVGPNQVHDWFVWNDGGTMRLCHGPAWTSDSVRSLALVMAQGILINSIGITNGPITNFGTYVGTTRSNGSSHLDWIYGDVSAGGTAGWFGVWNAYNRVNVTSKSGDSAGSWTIGTAWSSNSFGTRHYFVSGLAEDAFDFKYAAFISNAANFATAGIGVDVITAFSGTTGYVGGNIAASSTAFYSTTALGFHFVAAIEFANGTGSIAFGNAGFPAALQSGIWFSGRM